VSPGTELFIASCIDVKSALELSTVISLTGAGGLGVSIGANF